MSEVILNGTFDSNLDNWTNASGDVDWEYDATGADHDGGSAKMEHISTENTTLRARMYQNITISNTSTINTAVMTAWVQWNDAAAGQNDEVDNSTAKFWVQLKDPNNDFWNIGSAEYNYGDLQSVEFLSNENVKARLQAGGDGTWGVYLICDIARANVTPAAVAWMVAWFDDISLDIVQGYSDTVTGTIEVSSSASHLAAYSDTSTGTIEVSGSSSDSAGFADTSTGTINVTSNIGSAQTIRNDYAYYLGTDNGTIHETSSEFKGDAGVVIPCTYITKDTDFSDQNQPMNDRWKTVYAVKVFYEDMYSSTAITVGISTDGGTTWSTMSKTLGTGDETRKDATYHFMVTGQFFRFKIFSGSASTTFKLLGFEVEYDDSGEHWVTA